jgi:hypothetical protein
VYLPSYAADAAVAAKRHEIALTLQEMLEFMEEELPCSPDTSGRRSIRGQCDDFGVQEEEDDPVEQTLGEQQHEQQQQEQRGAQLGLQSSSADMKRAEERFAFFLGSLVRAGLSGLANDFGDGSDDDECE